MTIFGAMFIIWIFRLLIELIKTVFIMIYNCFKKILDKLKPLCYN